MKNFPIVLCFMLFAFGVSGQVEVYSAAGSSETGVCTGLIAIVAKGDAGPFDIEVYSENPSGPDYLLKQDQLDGVQDVNINYPHLIAQRYTVFVTDAFGCVNTEEVEISCGCDLFQWEDLPNSYSITNPSSCDSGDGAISYYSQTGRFIKGGLRPFSYAWDDGLSSTSFDRGGLSAGDYEVTVTDSYGCELTKTYTFVADDEPYVASSLKHPCEGLTNGALGFVFLPVDATNTMTYNWDIVGGSIVQLDKYRFTIDNMPAGLACVQVTNDNTGCVYDYCYELVEIRSCGDYEIDEESIVLEKSCPLQSTGMATVNAKGGNPNGVGFYPEFCNYSTYDSYQWKRMGENDILSTSKSILFVPAGFYGVTITDRCGRTVSTQVEIEEHPLITIPAPQIDRGCPGEGVITYSNIGGGAGPPYTAVWSNGQTGPQASGLSTGTYTVTITDVAGCEETRDVFIANYPAPEISFSDLVDPCFDVPALQSFASRFSYRDGSVSSSVSWGTETFSIVKYEWTVNGVVESTSKDLVFDGLELGFSQTEFVLRVEDSNGCEAAAAVIFINSIEYDRRLSELDCSCELAALCDGVTNFTHIARDGSGWKECGLDIDDCRRVECQCTYPSAVTTGSASVPLTVNEPELVCPDIEEFKPYTEELKENCETNLLCPTFTQVNDSREGKIDKTIETPNCKLIVNSIDPNPYDISNPPDFDPNESGVDNISIVNVEVPPFGGDVSLKIFMEKDLANPVFSKLEGTLQEGAHLLEVNFSPTCIGRYILRVSFGDDQSEDLLWFVQNTNLCQPDIEDEDSDEEVSSMTCVASSEDLGNDIVDCEFWTVGHITPNPFAVNQGFQTYPIISSSTGTAKIRILHGDGGATEWHDFEVENGENLIADPGTVYSSNTLTNGVLVAEIDFQGEIQAHSILALTRPANPVQDPHGKGRELHQSTEEGAVTGVVQIAESTLRIYPNPFTSVFAIDFEGLSSIDEVKYTIVGMDGRKVMEAVSEVSTSKVLEIDCAHLSKGVYVLKVESGSFIASKKIIKYD